MLLGHMRKCNPGLNFADEIWFAKTMNVSCARDKLCGTGDERVKNVCLNYMYNHTPPHTASYQGLPTELVSR